MSTRLAFYSRYLRLWQGDRCLERGKDTENQHKSFRKHDDSFLAAIRRLMIAPAMNSMALASEHKAA